MNDSAGVLCQLTNPSFSEQMAALASLKHLKTPDNSYQEYTLFLENASFCSVNVTANGCPKTSFVY